MGAEDSIKKMKRKIAMETRKVDSGMGISHTEGHIHGAGTEEKKNNGKKKKKKSSGEIRVEAEIVETCHVKDETLETSKEKKKSRKLRGKKENKSRMSRRNTEGFDASNSNEVKDSICKRVFDVEPSKDELPKPRQKKRKNVEGVNHFGDSNKRSDASEQCNDADPGENFSNSGVKGDAGRRSKKAKSKKSEKNKKESLLVESHLSSDNLPVKSGENAEDEAYLMSSGDEDYSKGMRKWITQYHQSRPGLKILQEGIDDFIMAHDAKEEQARAEELAQAAEGGWTVVVHQKGRKKTIDAESGIAVGAVAQAAVLDKMGKKKKKEVGPSFYQFHKREAHRNEIMMLQSKFEQDKKRIQQMRAARKFRPY